MRRVLPVARAPWTYIHIRSLSYETQTPMRIQGVERALRKLKGRSDVVGVINERKDVGRVNLFQYG